MADNLSVDTATRNLVGRFAPSPTGPLHFGSLVAAVGSYCHARHHGGTWHVRMEDLDQPRVVPGAADGLLLALERLGLHWDGPVVFQSQRLEQYRAAMSRLCEAGQLFACGCSRKEILATAPHPGEEGPIYPGTCRQGLPPGKTARATRIRVPQQAICFDDGVFGQQCQALHTHVGDFVLRRADGVFSYQLAVVVDDIAAGVTHVVRGADLLGSTPRQIYLYQQLEAPSPQYIHLPMVVGEDGRKVSKRDQPGPLEELLGPSECLWQALCFLGQDPPADLRDDCVEQILAWAVPGFALDAIPQAARTAPRLLMDNQ